MKRFTINPLRRFLVCALFTFSFIAITEASPLEGVWINTNPDTDSIPKIEITTDANGKASFIWWGKTHPENSEYGPFDLKLYHKSVGDNQPASSGTVAHETHFSDALFTLTMDGGYLKVLNFTKFKDDSGRKPYCLSLTFKRE